MAVFMYFYSKYMKQKYALYMHPDPKFKVILSFLLFQTVNNLYQFYSTCCITVLA